MDWVDKPQDYKDLYGILQTLRGSHLNNFPRKTLKLGWVALHSVTVQLKRSNFQPNQYKKLVPVLSRFCNCLFRDARVTRRQPSTRLWALVGENQNTSAAGPPLKPEDYHRVNTFFTSLDKVLAEIENRFSGNDQRCSLCIR